jgi:hypothetical protein
LTVRKLRILKLNLNESLFQRYAQDDLSMFEALISTARIPAACPPQASPSFLALRSRKPTNQPTNINTTMRRMLTPMPRSNSLHESNETAATDA